MFVIYIYTILNDMWDLGDFNCFWTLWLFIPLNRTASLSPPDVNADNIEMFSDTNSEELFLTFLILHRSYIIVRDQLHLRLK